MQSNENFKSTGKHFISWCTGGCGEDADEQWRFKRLIRKVKIMPLYQGNNALIKSSAFKITKVGNVSRNLDKNRFEI